VKPRTWCRGDADGGATALRGRRLQAFPDRPVENAQGGPQGRLGDFTRICTNLAEWNTVVAVLVVGHQPTPDRRYTPLNCRP
jgi:hypothetical protein